MSEDRTPQQALDEIRLAREQMFQKMDGWPWWYDAGYAASLGILVAGGGYPTVISLACTGVGLAILGLIVRKWIERTGVWVNGYKPRRARWVAIGLAVVLIGLMMCSLTLGRYGGIAWIPPVMGLAGGALAVIGSRIWTRIYLAETREVR